MPVFNTPDLPYNKICWPMAHDSHTATKNYSDDDDVPENVDQTQPVDQQLAGGIRAVRISNGTSVIRVPGPPGVWPGTPFVQHGDPHLTSPVTTFGTLEDYLTKVLGFIQNNSNEIVTIIDEGDGDLDQVAPVYEKVFGSLLFKPDMNEIRDQNYWPDVGDMVAKGQRVVVFMSNYGEPAQYPWIIPAYAPDGLIAMNFYDAYVPDQIRPAVPDWFFKSDRWPSQGPPNRLFMLNHQFCDQLVGRTESSRAYNIWTVGDLLVENTVRCAAITGCFPNFLNVDFYQGVCGAHSYLIDLANAINATGGWADRNIILAMDTPAFLQNTVSSQHPQGLQIGASYMLISVPTLQDGRTNLAVSASEREAGSGTYDLTLQPFDGDGQSFMWWQLVYNTPSAGVALVNPYFSMHLSCTDEIEACASLAAGTGVTHIDNGNELTGWEIGVQDADAGYYWIRHSYNHDRHLEVEGDACNEGDALQIYSWQDGDPNQLFFFRLIS